MKKNTIILEEEEEEEEKVKMMIQVISIMIFRFDIYWLCVLFHFNWNVINQK